MPDSSNLGDYFDALVEDLEFLDFLEIIFVEVRVGDVEPLEFLESEQDLRNDVRGELCRHQTQSFHFDAVAE